MPFSIIYYICCFICVYIIIIGCRIAELVISINNICSDIKLYYILSIVSFTFFVSCPILFYINGLYEKRLITILLYIAMILCFSVDGVSYFFYIYEDIDNKALLSLMIVSDILLALNSIMYMGEP